MRLTRTTFLLAAAIALLGIVEQWQPLAPVPLWRLLAALLVALLGYEWLVVRRAAFSVDCEPRPPLALGRPERLTLSFRNGSARPLTVLFAPALPAELVHRPEPRRLELPAGTERRAAVPAQPLALGEHRWRELPVRLRGPLRLGWWSRRCRLDTPLRVVPDLLRRATEAAAGAEQGRNPRGQLGRGSDLHHLRSYQPGDPRQVIDWKATARAGGLITRVFAEDQHLEIVLLLDVGRTAATEVAGLSQLGHYVNTAARFAERAAAGDDRVGLVAVADRPCAQVPAQRGRAAVLAVRRALTDLTAQPVETDLVQGALAVRRLVRHRGLVVLLTDLYGQDPAGQLGACVRLLRTTHLPLVVGLLDDGLQAYAARPAERWLDPYTSLAAREFLRRLHANAAALRRQGCQVLVSGPRRLDAQVLELYRTLRSERRI
ncbi:MAG TPA: DUF58 domain-containing protein [Pseudomonadales bacterium]